MYSRPVFYPVQKLIKGTFLFRSKLLLDQLVARVKSPAVYPQESLQASNKLLQKISKLAWARDRGRTTILSDLHRFSPQETVFACLVTDERSLRTDTLLVDVSREHNDIRIIDTVSDTHYCVLPNERELLFVRCDERCRPYQVWLHRNGQKQDSDVLLYEETRPSCHMTVAMTRDNKYVTVTTSTRTSSEVRILQSSSLNSPQLVRPLQSGVHYYIDHAHNQFYILTDIYSEYAVMTSCDDEPENWTSYFTSPDNFIIQDIELFRDFLLIYGTSRSLAPAVAMKPTSTNDQQHGLIHFDGFTDMQKSNQPFHADTCKLMLSSLVSPPTLKEISLKDDKSQSVLRPDSRYALEKTTAVSADGTSVPITLFYEPRLLSKDSSNPLLAKVYGSHGLPVSMRYDVGMMSLIRRGWIIAFCHIRGGGELGRQWYYSALGANKMRSFEDLRACLSHLHSAGFSQPHRTAVWGRSAGGLPVAMLCNLWPHLLQAAVLEYPVVNLIDCLTNGSHYISELDATEFGDSSDGSTRSAVQSVCPTANLSCQDYPSIMVLASKADELIPFATVEQYVTSLSDFIYKYRAKKKTKLLQRLPHQNITSQLPRGTVVFQTDETGSHYESPHHMIRRLNQGCQISVFLHKSLGLPTKVI